MQFKILYYTQNLLYEPFKPDGIQYTYNSVPRHAWIVKKCGILRVIHTYIYNDIHYRLILVLLILKYVHKSIYVVVPLVLTIRAI